MLVEDIQDIIENKLMEYKKYNLAKTYIIYRYTRALVRKSNTTDETILSIIKNSNKNINYDTYSVNTSLALRQKDLIAKEVSRDLTYRILLPEDIINAHLNGILYFHDADYFIQPMFNSSLVNLSDMLDNGTVINGKLIESPKSFSVACTILTQIIALVASSEYGSETVDISILGKYLRRSYLKIKNDLENKYKDKIDDDTLNDIINDALDKELKSGVQTIKYQFNTLMTTSGKSPYVSLFLHIDSNDQYKDFNAKIIEEIFRQRIKGIKDEKGCFSDVRFPKLLYVLNDDNCLNGGCFDYLTNLAIECAKLRQTPSFISSKVMKNLYNGCVIPPIYPNHFLSLYKENGNYKFEGRFNQGIVSINLVNVALKSYGDEDKFFLYLYEHLDLCKEALFCKHNALLGITSNVSPIHFEYGAISRLNSDEKIDKLLNNGYSTISLSYFGLNEVVKYMKNTNIDTALGKSFALKIVKALSNTLKKWKDETGIGFVLLSYYDDKIGKYFLDNDKEKYGIIKDITDKDCYSSAYFTSYNYKKKYDIESDFIKLSNGGSVFKIDISSLESDEKEVIKFIYDNVVYSEFIK